MIQLRGRSPRWIAASATSFAVAFALGMLVTPAHRHAFYGVVVVITAVLAAIVPQEDLLEPRLQRLAILASACSVFAGFGCLVRTIVSSFR